MPAEKKFQPMKAGEAPSLIEAERANELLDHAAAVDSMTIIPQGAGTFKVAGRASVLDLTGLINGDMLPEGTLRVRLVVGGVAQDADLAGELVA